MEGETRLHPSRNDAMLLRTCVPQMPLALFVDYFWYFEGYKPAHSKELALPDGSVEVVIDLREDTIRLSDREKRDLTFGSSILCGPHSEFFVIDTSVESPVMGIHFKPGGVYPFLKMPLDELNNTHVSLDTLWGARAGELRDELLASPTPDGKFRILERRLRSLAVRPLAQHPAVQFALMNLQSSTHTGAVADLIRQTGFSHRRFNQIFKEEVGLTPKRLYRLLRFREVLRLIGNGRLIDWSDIAIACGYYDQAHFIKDFKAFSGINPSDYRTISGRHENHVALRP